MLGGNAHPGKRLCEAIDLVIVLRARVAGDLEEEIVKPGASGGRITWPLSIRPVRRLSRVILSPIGLIALIGRLLSWRRDLEGIVAKIRLSKNESGTCGYVTGWYLDRLAFTLKATAPLHSHETGYPPGCICPCWHQKNGRFAV